MHDLLILILLIFSGVILAWIVNFLSDVLPIKRKLTHPVCVHCQQEVHWVDYLLFKKCTHCNQSRKIRNWLVYAFIPVGLLYLWLFPNSIGSNGVSGMPVMNLILKGILLVYFVLITVIDLEYKAILFPVIIVGIVYGALFGYIYRGWVPTLLGFAVGFAIMLVFYFLGILFLKILNRKREQKLQEDALGFGDVNLAGVLGLVLGFPGIFAGLFLGIIIGGFGSMVYLGVSKLFGKYKIFTPLPYAPFLISGAAILLFIL